MREFCRRTERMTIQELSRKRNNLRPVITLYLRPGMYSLGPNSPFDIAGSLADKRKADDLAVLSFAEDVVVSKRPRLETELAGGDISFEADMELDSNYPSGWSEKELPECVRISDRPREILDLLNSSNFEQHLVCSSYVYCVSCIVSSY